MSKPVKRVVKRDNTEGPTNVRIKSAQRDPRVKLSTVTKGTFFKSNSENQEDKNRGYAQTGELYQVMAETDRYVEVSPLRSGQRLKFPKTLLVRTIRDLEVTYTLA